MALKEIYFPPKKNRIDPIRRSISNPNFNRLVNFGATTAFIRVKAYNLVIEMEGLLYCTVKTKPLDGVFLEINVRKQSLYLYIFIDMYLVDII